MPPYHTDQATYNMPLPSFAHVNWKQSAAKTSKPIQKFHIHVVEREQQRSWIADKITFFSYTAKFYLWLF